MHELTATHLIKFLIYRPVPQAFENYISTKLGFLIEIPSVVTKAFETNKNINGCIFTGDLRADRRLWSLLCPGGSFQRFITDVDLVGNPFLIIAPEKTVNLLQREMLKKKILIFPYECKDDYRNMSLCRCFVGENKNLLIVKEDQLVAMN